MAAGDLQSWFLWCKWDGTNWVDESSYIKGIDDIVTVTRGRATVADDIQTGVLSATLDEVGARHIPDNPLSPLYPLVKDGVPTWFQVRHGGVTYDRHFGALAVGEPSISTNGVATASMPIQSVGLLGELAGRTMRCDFVERWLNTAETNNVDLWPLEGLSLTNIGSANGVGTVVPGPGGAGTAEVTSPDGIMLDSAITLTLAGTRGPSLNFRVSSSIANTTAIAVPFRTGDRVAAGGAPKVLIRCTDNVGGQLWAVKLVDNAGQTDLNLYDFGDNFMATLYYGFSAIGEDAGDDQWFVFSLQYIGGSQFATLRRASDSEYVYSNTVGMDARQTRGIKVGGATNMTVGAIAVSPTDDTYGWLLSPNVLTTTGQRYADMNVYADFASLTSGSRNASIWRKSISGRSAFDVLAEVARTTGSGVVEYQNQRALKFLDSDTQRLPDVAVTVDLRADSGDDIVWRKGEIPSVVTATYPGGQVTLADSTRVRSDYSVDTCAADDLTAADVAGFFLNQSRRLRITRLVIDLASGTNNLVASVMALEVGQRIRVTLGSTSTDPLVAHFGSTYVDVYAMGWTEVYGENIIRFEIDCAPADDPVEGEFDSDLRGRFTADPGSMTVTGGTAVGTTSTGTVIVTTTAGSPTVTTDATAYPITFDWNGEQVTVTSAPASSSSPQTLTITARGVAPTVARVHSGGEPFDVAYPATFTL